MNRLHYNGAVIEKTLPWSRSYSQKLIDNFQRHIKDMFCDYHH